ncbi:MAG: DegT/DnrJ/EryC1/StrS family aminotransferase [Psychroflexus sp.]
MNEKIWLSSPHMGTKEQEYVNEAFETNWIAPLGPHVNGFEKELSQYVNSNKHVAALSSGTSAIHLALILAGVQRDDYVVCQSMTFSASANPIIYQGAHPVFVDSETETWNLCPQQLRKAIEGTIQKHGKKPKAIIGVHLYGMPYKVDEINAIAKEYDIPVIEDAAEALGSQYKGRNCASLGDYGILSFNGNKIITTSGGGALVCHTEEEKQKAIFYSTQARDDAPHYQHSELGFNYRLSNVAAGIGRGQLEVIEDRVEARRSNYDFYRKAFSNLKGFEFLEEPEGLKSNRWLSTVLIHPEKAGFTREDIRLALLKENIETRPLWKPMHLQPFFKAADYYGTGVAEALFEKGLCLPSGSNLTQEDLERVKKAVLSC